MAVATRPDGTAEAAAATTQAISQRHLRPIKPWTALRVYTPVPAVDESAAPVTPAANTQADLSEMAMFNQVVVGTACVVTTAEDPERIRHLLTDSFRMHGLILILNHAAHDLRHCIKHILLWDGHTIHPFTHTRTVVPQQHKCSEQLRPKACALQCHNALRSRENALLKATGRHLMRMSVCGDSQEIKFG